MKIKPIKSPASKKPLLTPAEVDKIGVRYTQLKTRIKEDSSAVSEITQWVNRNSNSMELRGKVKAFVGRAYQVGLMLKTRRTVDLDRLKSKISSKVWKSIRIVQYTVDEAALARAVADGVIPAALLKKCIVETPITPSLYIRPLKANEDTSS